MSERKQLSMTSISLEAQIQEVINPLSHAALNDIFCACLNYFPDYKRCLSQFMELLLLQSSLTKKKMRNWSECENRISALFLHSFLEVMRDTCFREMIALLDVKTWELRRWLFNILWKESLVCNSRQIFPGKFSGWRSLGFVSNRSCCFFFFLFLSY